MHENSNHDIKNSLSFAPPSGDENSTKMPDASSPESFDGTKVPTTGTGSLGNLFQITQELHALEMALIDSGGEMPAELEDRFTTASIAREKKVDAYHAIMDRCDHLEAEYKAKADFFAKIAKSAKATRNRLKESLKQAMSFLQVSDLEGEMIRFKLSDGKPRVEIFNEGDIPMEYLKEEVRLVPNMERIETMLKAGEQVPGCKLTSSSTLRTYPARKTK